MITKWDLSSLCPSHHYFLRLLFSPLSASTIPLLLIWTQSSPQQVSAHHPSTTVFIQPFPVAIPACPKIQYKALPLVKCRLWNLFWARQGNLFPSDADSIFITLIHAYLCLCVMWCASVGIVFATIINVNVIYIKEQQQMRSSNLGKFRRWDMSASL